MDGDPAAAWVAEATVVEADFSETLLSGICWPESAVELATASLAWVMESPTFLNDALCDQDSSVAVEVVAAAGDHEAAMVQPVAQAAGGAMAVGEATVAATQAMAVDGRSLLTSLHPRKALRPHQWLVT